MNRQYTIFLDPDYDESGYTVTVPALPACITQGQTVEECLERAPEAIEGHLAVLAATGQSIPIERIRPQAITLTAGIPTVAA